MKSDELNGGLKIFHGDEENSEESRPETQTGFQRISQTHNKLPSLVDLVMWRDVSKSAFVFGIGTFIIIASSYTKDINISFITVVSYLGLVYLAANFLFKSIICRGVIGGDDTNQDYVVGEEEAVWLVKMILPYLNEFLLKFRALCCGDPATTMKSTELKTLFDDFYSFITMVSYLGLVYLAVIFLFRSIICRGVIGGDDTNQDCVVGEEEAVCLVKIILPYLNEFLLKFRALFCGDPATTIKLAIMLFVLAKCGSSITIWKMAKLGEL
ncbi:Reticulon-like protein B21 [Camellia lanceoleosa]|uniref:Reticulon-like protein B21 n=1 Tax=Camellia lanceoleosa TaxID=1840588 RepID=A0ACC0GVD2_9ERIC|nr:Reticulon-like protein B21 [Camellia lanceoleosa]